MRANFYQKNKKKKPIGRNVQAVLDDTGKYCIFNLVHDRLKKLVAVDIETCKTKDAGYVGKKNRSWKDMSKWTSNTGKYWVKERTGCTAGNIFQ